MWPQIFSHDFASGSSIVVEHVFTDLEIWGSNPAPGWHQKVFIDKKVLEILKITFFFIILIS
jgi:hypothetical protein